MQTHPTQRDFSIIDALPAAQELLSAIETVDTIAVDTEADSFHHFHHKVCLIQLAAGEHCYIVDPLTDLDVQPILEALAEKRLIFHDAGYDLRMLLGDFNFCPRGEIFDTMLAARLVGLDNISLSALLQDILGVNVSKKNQRADWAKRPIADDLLAYAAEDVRYLKQLTDYLDERLAALGRQHWHQEYCQWTIEQSQVLKTPQDPDSVWRIRGTHGLSPRQMAFVRAVWQWRQEQSSRANLSPFRILHNDRIIELALWAERQKVIVPDKLPHLPRHCQGGRRRELLDALNTAATMPPDQWPHPPARQRDKRPSAEILKKTDRLKSECSQIADTLGLPPQLIASRKSLLAAVNTGADTEEKLVRIGWMHWQAKLLLEPLRTVINE